MNIGFIGLGKLGLDCAEVFAEKHTVCGYDISPRHSDSVKVYAQVEQVIENSDWIFIAVPTPHEEGYDGSVPSSHMEPRDFGHDAVKQAIGYVNTYAREPKRVVLISTVLPGTTRRHFINLLDRQHQFLYNPYLIAMGSVKWDMVNPEMVMIGTDDGNPNALAGELVDLYKSIMQNDPRYVIGTWDECEAIKIFYNTFISTKVGLANMIQDFAMRIGHINVDVVTDALAQSTMRIMGPKYMTAGMGDAGACHPRDNIALRWLAKEYDIGYDLFDTIMHAREIQARNLAQFLVDQSDGRVAGDSLPIVIHGKAYKPDVPYCIGSYSTLIGHYVKELGHDVRYLDPLADDSAEVITEVNAPCVLLMAHNRHVTYGYTGDVRDDTFYCNIPEGSVIVDPWRRMPLSGKHSVIYYGNTRDGQTRHL
jgi:UDPglucose 6-dehydrogenase